LPGALPPGGDVSRAGAPLFQGVLKPPFNDEGRAAAGFSAVFYAPLAAD
jgi:uncharacterized ferritin-like protein (DUF455 family)